MLSSANGQPCYAGAGSQAAEKEKLGWGGVQSVVGCFLSGYMLGNLGGERENGGEKLLWYEAQPVGEWCLKEEASCVRLGNLFL